ncbi:MAG: lactate racemase domain-containing protein, partial [Candidatus Nanoarchaeia archaeon]
MSAIVSKSGENLSIGKEERIEILSEFLKKTGLKLKKVLILPPDLTRYNSAAGQITEILFELLKGVEVDIMPALGTHAPMTEKEIRHMFGEKIPLARFKVHDWRKSLIHLGDVPSSLISEWSEGKLDYSVKMEVNKILF